MSDFYGLPTSSIANQHLRLAFLATAGPRIVRLFLNGSDENLLAEVPDVIWELAEGTFHIRGGHRLWHAPEHFPRTYQPDNEGLVVEELADGVRLTQPTEAATGIRKQIEIHLHADKPIITLNHYLHNDGLWPIELAPWGITQVPLGGVAVLPQPFQGDPNSLLPNRHLSLWAYTRLDDPRLSLYDDYILVRGQSLSEAVKIGYLNTRGWFGYLYRGVFFCKHFVPQPEQQHPDNNCNTECFCKDRFLELETLAPFTLLEPDQAVEHTETWTLYPDIETPSTLEGIRELVKTLDFDSQPT